MLPTIIYTAMSNRGPYSLHFPKYYIPFATLVLTVCKFLFYKFYKIGTSLNIKESDQTLYDATPGLGQQCSPSLTNCKPQERQRKCRNPALIPVTEAKWFGSRLAPVSRAWHESNCLHVTSPHQGERDKSRWMSMDVYIYVSRKKYIKILRSMEIWLIGWVSLCQTSHQQLSRSYGAWTQHWVRVWRQGHDIEPHTVDWRSQGSNSGPHGHKASGLYIY